MSEMTDEARGEEAPSSDAPVRRVRRERRVRKKGRRRHRTWSQRSENKQVIEIGMYAVAFLLVVLMLGIILKVVSGS